jgi:hypothetical protein
VHGSAVKSEEINIGSAAFFAPLTAMAPARLLPP